MDATAFRVTSFRGHFDFLHPKDYQVQVVLERPGFKRVAFTVDEERLSVMRPDERWSSYLEEALQSHLSRYISSQDAELRALLAWVQDEANARALDTAWAEQRVAALHAQIEQLCALHAEATEALAELRAPAAS